MFASILEAITRHRIPKEAKTLDYSEKFPKTEELYALGWDFGKHPEFKDGVTYIEIKKSGKKNNT